MDQYDALEISTGSPNSNVAPINEVEKKYGFSNRRRPDQSQRTFGGLGNTKFGPGSLSPSLSTEADWKLP